MAKELSPVLCIFFNTSLRLVEVPGAFKEAHVTPVPKGGDVTLVSNYQPISLEICTRNFGIRICEVYVMWASGNRLSTLEGILNLQTKTKGSST